MNSASALNQYKSVSVQSSMADATPHHLICKLLDGAMDRLAAAKGAIERNEVARKGELLGSAIAIIDGLRASLDYEQGAEIAANLGALYDYMERRLVEANAASDVSIVEEIAGLLKEIRAGWDSLPAEIRNKRS
ncbi:MAG: flagellar export chaperone FliS [Porticoccaceae bacterium]